MASRKVAIVNYIDERNVKENILDKLPEGCSPVVFMQPGNDASKYPGAETVLFPEDLCSKPAAKNFVADYAKKAGWTGWLYIFEDDMKIVAEKDSLEEFMFRLENMLDKLGLDTWMNTATDLFNHIFTKYVHRFKAVIDDPEYTQLVEQIIFCSHANPNVMVFNMDTVKLEKMKFDEDFEIPMYYIIAYLASRRNDKNDPGVMFMNFYPTVPGEDQMWKRDKDAVSGKYTVSDERRAKEDTLFKQKEIAHHADIDVMKVLDFVKERLDAWKASH